MADKFTPTPLRAFNLDPVDADLLFFQRARMELVSARTKHARDINSPHEGYAVILEEVDELWTEVKLQTSARDPAEMLKELTQIAAMCARMATDLGLVR